jgi:hypothetical protein
MNCNNVAYRLSFGPSKSAVTVDLRQHFPRSGSPGILPQRAAKLAGGAAANHATLARAVVAADA